MSAMTTASAKASKASSKKIVTRLGYEKMKRRVILSMVLLTAEVFIVINAYLNTPTSFARVIGRDLLASPELLIAPVAAVVALYAALVGLYIHLNRKMKDAPVAGRR